MSRIDEAMKRAAQRRVSAAGDSPSLGLPAGVEPQLPPVVLEDYPLEPSEEQAVPAAGVASTAPVRARRVGKRRLERLSTAVDGKVVVSEHTSAASVEQYRRLAASLHGLQVERGLKVIMVSSAVPREGKTLTSTNLALTLSESYKRRVLLIDADLRRPCLHDVFRVPNATGLAEALREPTSTLPLIDLSPRITLLPAGRPDPTPMAGLTSARMQTLLKDAAARYDWVIIDTAPLGLISDANLLARLVDGVLLVIGAGSTDYALVQRMLTELGPDRVIGVVLNRVTSDVGSQQYYRRYYYQAETAANGLPTQV